MEGCTRSTRRHTGDIFTRYKRRTLGQAGQRRRVEISLNRPGEVRRMRRQLVRPEQLEERRQEILLRLYDVSSSWENGLHQQRAGADGEGQRGRARGLRETGAPPRSDGRRREKGDREVQGLSAREETEPSTLLRTHRRGRRRAPPAGGRDCC